MTSCTDAAALEFSPYFDLADLLDDLKSGKRRWFAEGLIDQQNRLIILAGAEKSGKSWCAADLAVATCTETDFLGQFAIKAPGHVMILDGEYGPYEMVRRLARLARGRGLTPKEVLANIRLPRVRWPLDLDVAEELEDCLDGDDLDKTVTVNEIARDLFEAEEQENPRATQEARSVYRNHLTQPLGGFDVAAVSPAFLRERVFEPMARKGLAQATLQNVRIVARKVFKFAIYRQLIERNPVDDIYKLPRAKKDHRPFVLPTDEEFVLLVNYLHGRPPTENTGGVGALELATLIISSRFIGGQRASDLHAWRWSDIDQETWKSCTVRRPKTERDEHGELVQRTVRVTHMINDDERDALKRWWEHEKKPKPKRDEHGKLTHDPLVFPTRTGKRAGEPKKGMGYASALRVAMTRALGLEVPETEVRTRTRKYKDGSTRKMTYEATVWRAVRKPKGREVTLLLGDEDYRPLNMHTMRRAYASGLAMAGWSRAKMRTAGGWATDAMPARYDLSAQHEQVDAKGTTPRLKLVGA